ncbi:STAS domain-containing protein [Actinacidiphila rubida]|uniref:STAS domain-containing protein n=1 Tax=Actinacidiphila rubida TaxID=310780 RepID=A0A1H8UAX8_9ACTN|nr:STAS domain-containing protein [Actinacidiphila rubida]SEP00256.1 hypothetical protein SAMN05216267_10684 [Actinacidiphila rubida]
MDFDTLLRAHHHLVADGGRLALVVAQRPMARILEITSVDTMIPLYPTVTQALNS